MRGHLAASSSFCVGAPVSRLNAVAQIGAAGRADDVADRAMGEHPALVQDHDIVAASRFIDQMRRPQHADPLHRRQPANMIENVGARLDIEADRRFVQQKQAGLMQQRPGDFDAAHLPDREIADPILAAIGHRYAIQDLRDQIPGSAAWPIPCSAA